MPQDYEQEFNDMAKTISDLQAQVTELQAQFNKNNFTSTQVFPKYSNFSSRLKVPHSDADPMVGDVGDIVEVGGKLLICTVASSTAPTFVVVGSQS